MPSCLCTSSWRFQSSLFLFFLPSSLFRLFFCSHITLHPVSSFFIYLRVSPFPLSEQALHRRPVSCLLGSTGSETVTQSSLVIGHGHANQTGRNLQLIRILPPAIIPLTTTTTPFLTLLRPCKINYIWGSIPTIGFPVLKPHYKRTNPKTTEPS